MPGRLVVVGDRGVALERCVDAGEVEPFHARHRGAIDLVAGGAEIYRAALPRVERLYLTRIHAAFEGDTSFPDYDPTPWHLREYADFPADDRNPYPYSFRTYDRTSQPVVSSLANSSR